jgi:hypothetical protein
LAVAVAKQLGLGYLQRSRALSHPKALHSLGIPSAGVAWISADSGLATAPRPNWREARPEWRNGRGLDEIARTAGA